MTWLVAWTLMALGLDALTAHANPTVGWRDDGRGVYPDAEPVTEWSDTKNVVWKTPLKYSNAMPLLMGEKIYVSSPPCFLSCLSAADGKILWQKANAFSDFISSGEWARAEKDIAKARTLAKETKSLRGKLQLMKRKKQTGTEAFRENSAKLEALQAEHRTLTKYGLPKPAAGVGFATPTPVSDGKHIWVLYGHGVVVCYDLAGNRKWIRFVEKGTNPRGIAASPILVGEKLIIQITHLMALNKDTGEEIWKTEIPFSYATPASLNLGGKDVLVAGCGRFLDPSSGEVLAKPFKNANATNSPAVHDGMVHFGRTAFAPTVDASGKFALGKPIKYKPAGFGSASPARHDGLLYFIGKNFKGLYSVVDAKTGALVAKRKVDWGRKTVGQTFSCVTVAGDYVLMSTDRGEWVVMKAGREPEQVASNFLPKSRSTPVFRGKRMYLRAGDFLYCIGK